MGMDPKVYASGPQDVKMQNPCEVNEYPGRRNIPKTHTNHCLAQTLLADPLRIANRRNLLFFAAGLAYLANARVLQTVGPGFPPRPELEFDRLLRKLPIENRPLPVKTMA